MLVTTFTFIIDLIIYLISEIYHKYNRVYLIIMHKIYNIFEQFFLKNHPLKKNVN